MNAETKPIVLMDSPEAATYRADVKGWVSRNGLFFGDRPESEDIARFNGATHRKCNCGAVIDKSYTMCDDCHTKADHARWLALPLIEWDGETPLCIYLDDTYFWSAEEVYEHAENHDIKVSDLDLVVCEPRYAHCIGDDSWEDELPEDGDMPGWLEDAVNALNAVIHAHRDEPLSWIGGKQRVVLPDEQEQVPAEGNSDAASL